ncbi:serine/threonine-protein kinase [Paenarthrobacter nitroguajacolicus]|uniref:serine/threonine-protein kinase n=1 Tax=Paenarthrobacter nitroguajacolicus TaxID=211146 RepID=UPI00248D1FD3|nr:serine/threonine-protein kinase [Paenarthrobacter nitroguajacolicus]MDI2034907.1 Serine/threonine-protein kinase PknD [Paenarthrobacter nitroguajacolicus]
MGYNQKNGGSGASDSVDGGGPSGALDGRYQLGPLLGRGAMSAVYRATDLVLGREVAVKIFLPGSGDDSFRARQETEMRLLAAFDHPGLVAAFDAGVDTRNDEERAYLVMELAGSRDLRALLSEGPLTVPETARIGIMIAGALAQVHEHGVIHRDIEPANILVSDDDGLAESVKLADFGVALVMNDNRLTATGFTVGTAQYLSPEQAQGLHLTPKSDIYSLGLVLLECLTGYAEYPGTPIETASARLHRAPQVPLELPAPLRSLLQAMTDMDPEMRPTAHEVEQALSEERIQTGRRTAVLPPLPQRTPLATTARTPNVVGHAGRPPAIRPRTRRPATITGIRDLSKRRPKTVRGVAAAVVAIPLAALVLSQGLTPTANTADPAKPASNDVSQADPQPASPVLPVPASPSPGAVPAEVADLQQASLPEPVLQNNPVPDNPGQSIPDQTQPILSPADMKGADIAKTKSDGKSVKPEKDKDKPGR